MTGSRNTTLTVCGTLVLLAAIGAVLYLSNSAAPDLAALGIIGTIVASVLAGTFGLAKLGSIESKVDTAVEQTNGKLTGRFNALLDERFGADNEVIRGLISGALRDAGLPPVAAGSSPVTRTEQEG